MRNIHSKKIRAAAFILSAATALSGAHICQSRDAEAFQLFYNLPGTASASPVTTASPSAVNTPVPSAGKHTQQEIRDYISKNSAALKDSNTYKTKPDYKTPYENAGELSDESKQSGLAMLNIIRYIAGLNADVTLNDSMGEKAQAASYLCALNGTLSHSPERPDGITDEIYNTGISGASSCNLAMGGGNLKGSVLMWTMDEDSSNIDRVGHRRWLLNPAMGQTGFGAAGGYSAVYAFDSSGSGRQTSVAWPAEQMPTDYFYSGEPWTYSVNRAVKGNVTVTLKRTGDGKTWTFMSGRDNDPKKMKYFNVDNSGYGMTGCIIFCPDGITKYSSGDSFEVTITEEGNTLAQYNVNFFNVGKNDEDGVDITEHEDSDLKKAYTYTGKEITPEVSVDGVDESGYSVEYSDNINVGRAHIQISGTGANTGTVVRSFKIIPKAVKSIKLSASHKKIKVRWKKGGKNQLTGYQIRYSVSGNTGKAKKIKTKSMKKTIKGIKAGRSYSVQIRAYKNVAEEGTFYSKWSSRKTVRAK